MDNNYHRHHQSITIHEAEDHIDHNQEMDFTINQTQAQNHYYRTNTYIGSLNDNREHQDMYWEHQTHNYREFKDKITEKVTNHTNKLMDNLEN